MRAAATKIVINRTLPTTIITRRVESETPPSSLCCWKTLIVMELVGVSLGAKVWCKVPIVDLREVVLIVAMKGAEVDNTIVDIVV